MENPLVDILGPHLKRKRKKVTKKERIWVKYNLQASVDPIPDARLVSYFESNKLGQAKE